jgi:RNA polymerase sigma-70 factor (ECF subfamily)
MDLEPHRGELIVYCYRMLGAFHEAEDLAQEVMLRAWRARESYDPQRASLRTWLYRIATNACLTELTGRARRPLPSGLGAASEDPAAPLTPAADIPWLEPFPDARLQLDTRTDVRLALVAALQILPARQRAVLILREVLEFSAAEVAEQLGMSVAAVNSALQRARATVAQAAPDLGTVAEPADRDALAVVTRYASAFAAGDVPALVRLLARDVVLEMPPVPLWYQGTQSYGRFMDRVFAMRGTGWSARRVSANGQPALATYTPGPDGALHAHSLQVFTVAGGLITRNVVFAEPRLFASFELPERI